MENIKTLRAKKVSLTIEIKFLKDYINDLEEMVRTQGERHFLKLYSGKLIPRYMLHGEHFFQEKITIHKLELIKLQAKRKSLDGI